MERSFEDSFSKGSSTGLLRVPLRTPFTRDPFRGY